MEWNPNDWQGRSEKQVNNNNKLFGISVISFVIGFFIILIILLLTSCKSMEKVDCDAYSMVENHQKNI